MNSFARSSLLMLLVACKATSHAELGESARRSGNLDLALAFQAVRETDAAPDPAVTLAVRKIEIAAGDALDYDFYAANVHAERAGIEVVFEDGSTLPPPLLDSASDPTARNEPKTSSDSPSDPHRAASPGWIHRSIPLDAESGSKTASFRLAALGAARGECVFYVDHVMVRSAGEASISLFDGKVGTAWHEHSSGGSRAACFGVDRAAHYPRAYVPAGGELPTDPWALMDLTVFRRAVHPTSAGNKRSASNAGLDTEGYPISTTVHAVDASTHSALDGTDTTDITGTTLSTPPTGVVFLGSGVPFRFGAKGEVPAIPADGQRLGLGGIEGGRYYDLHLAVAVEGAAEIDTHWQIAGSGGFMRPFSIRIAPDAASAAGSGFVTLSVPVAADFEILSLRLPNEPKLRVYAASLRWRKDAPGDHEFRRRWLAHEIGGEKVERYFRDVDVGPLFAALTGSSILAGEAKEERKLFDLALRSDTAGFDKLLASRLAAFEQESPTFKANRVTFVGLCPMHSGNSGNSGNARAPFDEARDPCVRNLESTVDAARDLPELAWALPSMQASAWLRAGDPARFDALCAAAACNRVDLARGSWAGECASGSSEAMVHDLLFARRFAQQHFDSMSDAIIGALPRDLAYARQFPQLCRSAGVRLLVGGTNGDCERPSAFAWSAPDGSSVTSAAWYALDNGGRNAGLDEKELTRRLSRSRGSEKQADILVAFDVDGDSAAGQDLLRQNLAAIDRISKADLAPAVSIATPSRWLESLHAEDDAPLPVWDGAREAARHCRTIFTPSRVRAGNRRAEAALERAERYAALARGDGLVYLRSEFEDLWQRLLWNESFEAGSRTAASAVEAEAQRIAARAEELTRGELAVLARSANTKGPGRPIVVFNALPWDRVEPIEIPEPEVDVLDTDLRPVVSQLTGRGTRVFQAALPSFGRAVFHLVPIAASAPSAAPAPAARTVAPLDEWTMSNERMSVTLDPKTGRLRSVKLLPRGDELLARAGIGGNVMMLFPRAGDAARSSVAGSTISAAAPEMIDELDSLRIVERGPVRSVARIERSAHGARIVQDLVLYANTAEITIRTRIEGGADMGRLCSAYEVKQVSPWVVYGVPFGSTSIACTKTDVGQEIHALDWITQSTSRMSFTACNDGGASFGAAGRVLSVTLDDSDVGSESSTVAGSGAKDAAPSAAREIQVTLHVDRENWRAGAIHAAAELEHPPQMVRCDAHDGVRPARHSFLRVARVLPDGHAAEGARSGLMMSTFKVAEEGDDWIVRVFETRGEAGTVRLTFDRPMFAAQGADLLEHPTSELHLAGKQVDLPIGPYRIETVRVSARPR